MALLDEEDDQALRCAECSAVVTSRDQAVAVNGAHEHAFFNPAGIAFEVRCFRQAPGATPQGEPTGAFTWFPGYCWRVVLCAACQAHLGWQFANGNSFHGLIADRLR